MGLLEETRSLCPVCMKIVPAQIITDGSRVFMQKKCLEHGTFQGLIWSDLALYQKSFRLGRKITKPAGWGMSRVRGCPYDCGLCPDHQQHTCLAILEITSKCNLHCPVCLASSGKEGENPTMEQISYALRKLCEYEGRSASLQISGGEPTLRKDLLEVVSIAKKFDLKSIEIDTNGVQLAKEPDLARDLANAGLNGIYLQFDGCSRDAQTTMRGTSDLLAIKEKAIKNAEKAGLEVALAATIVKGINDNHLWEIIRYAIKKSAKGVNFQPFVASGRFPANLSKPMEKVTVPDVVKGIKAQSNGQLEEADFLPIPCPDNRCAVLAYVVIKKGKIVPLNRMLDTEKIVEYYAEPADFEKVVEAATKMYSSVRDNDSCCSASLDQFKGQYFSVGCHGLQDIWNIDLNRVMKCCVHELTAEGKLVPFCLFNITSQRRESLYRKVQNPQI